MKHTSNIPVTTTTTPVLATGTTTAAVTSATDKQQKIDDDKLQSLRHSHAKKDDYPVLENVEFYTEWRIKMMRQIQLDGWERLTDSSF